MTYLLWEGLESSASDRSVHFKPYYRFYHGYNIFPSLIIIVIFIIIFFIITVSALQILQLSPNIQHNNELVLAYSIITARARVCVSVCVCL
mmetsp:Transcript_43023/g.69337  ORF Transcript_43023/g.69337 Transcript_43023/m.69337 type:complete len:91 (-) Transcript_43023:77-349(-)